jgi:hypothetical protein
MSLMMGIKHDDDQAESVKKFAGTGPGWIAKPYQTNSDMESH